MKTTERLSWIHRLLQQTRPACLRNLCKGGKQCFLCHLESIGWLSLTALLPSSLPEASVMLQKSEYAETGDNKWLLLHLRFDFLSSAFGKHVSLWERAAGEFGSAFSLTMLRVQLTAETQASNCVTVSCWVKSDTLNGLNSKGSLSAGL